MNRVDLAERATLGALLLEPDMVRLVSGWLHESDFGHPAARITYRLITAAAPHQGQIGAAQLLAAAMADEQARRNHVAGPYLHELLASPGGLGRSEVYARLVLHASVRRSLTCRARDLARVCATTEESPETIPDLLEATSLTLRRVSELWDRLKEADPDHETRPTSIAALRYLMPRPGAGRRVPEEDLIGALTDNPSVLREVSGWLTADDFSTPALASAYSGMLCLARQGMPVDHVTAPWGRPDRRAAEPSPPLHVVATRSRCTSYETIRMARTLLATSIAARTRAVSEAIAGMDRDPSTTGQQLLWSATCLLGANLEQACRWFQG